MEWDQNVLFGCPKGKEKKKKKNVSGLVWEYYENK